MADTFVIERSAEPEVGFMYLKNVASHTRRKGVDVDTLKEHSAPHVALGHYETGLGVSKHRSTRERQHWRNVPNILR